MKIRSLALLFALLATPGVAGAADPVAAGVFQAHIAAVAKKDGPTLIAQYRPEAFVWWIGGGLDGTYSGPAITALWTKFAATPGTLTPTIANLTQYDNPKGSTISADITYAGTNAAGAPVSVHAYEVLAIRDGKIQDDIWQVIPPK
jgi:hypothetical protein